jgi:hypothetical protein
MEWIWQGIAREWLAVTGAPFLYGVALIFVTTTVATVIWFLLNLCYKSILASKDAEVGKEPHIAVKIVSDSPVVGQVINLFKETGVLKHPGDFEIYQTGSR